LIKEVQELIQKGVSERKISAILKISRNTVSKYSSWDTEILAESASARPAFSKLEPFKEEIISLINNNKMKRQDAYLGIEKNGYTGGRSQFYKYCEHLAEMEMIDIPGDLRIDELRDEQTKSKYHFVSRREIFKYIWSGGGDIGKDDIEIIKTTFPVVNVLIKCLFEFRDIFKKKSKEALTEYIAAYKGCELGPLKKFSESMSKDIEPVTNAVVEEYSNGFVEGTNNKLKVIKRVAYGRCKLPLLRSKVILPTFFWP